ncbi:hypothetical protein PENFLA_c011G00146 [Penicillium flavigenum]|uniref:Major facilitator superfamily (MFS) profile domain-containing protein n=1 Tax=Penicillium flavigenum TaxID=254877 RepID=A0A1V6TAQ3_9EURO|nr:hypothetical protein PENFLA_c011G00146 [Penicillium flavigenum]
MVGATSFESEEIRLVSRESDIHLQVSENEDTILTGYKLVAVMVGLCCCVFCTSLDNTIIATTVPKIAAQFHSLGDIGWYASSYLLTTCAVTLTFGRIYTFYSVKWVYLSALFIFELGSLLCGIAPSSVGLIIGRAVAGLGGGGLFSGSLVIIAQCVPRHRRPAFSGLIMGMFAVASIIAPLLGGAFTDHLTWRWCFFINLPFGAVTAVTVFFTFQSTKPIVQATRREKLRGLDPLGTLFFLPAIVCLLLALQWGGSMYAWGDARIIGLFVVFGVLFLCFIALQFHTGEKATLPPRLLRSRNIWGSALFTFCVNSVMFIFVYYVIHSSARKVVLLLTKSQLPIWFQAVKGASATKSGIMNLPLVLSNVLIVMVSGVLVTVAGYYGPFMLLSAAMMCISAGLLTTFDPTASPAKWIGYQLFLGIAIGTGFQLPIFVVQTTLPTADIPTATALMTFTPLLGGSVFVSVAQNLFQNQLMAGLKDELPGLDATAVLATGPTELRDKYQDDTLQTLLGVYNEAVVTTFYTAVGLAAASFLGAAVIEWRPLKKTDEKERDGEGGK